MATPFRLTVTNWTTKAKLDLTERLLSSGRVQVIDEQERGAFERVAGDLRLEVSDQDNVVRPFLFITDQTVKLVVEVFVYVSGDFVRRWRGDVDLESVSFDEIDQMISFDAFAMIKAFWEKAKLTTVRKPPANFNPFWNSTYLTPFSVLFSDEVVGILDEGGRIFAYADPGNYGTTRSVRSNKAAGGPPYGDEGMRRLLNEKTTTETLLKACSIEYNAVLYIDAPTGALKMAPRSQTPSTFRDLADYVLDEKTEIKVTDGARYDYLLSYQRIFADAPNLSRFVNVKIFPDPNYARQLRPNWDYQYRVVGFVDGTAKAESQILGVHTPAVVSGWTGFAIELSLPAFPEGFTSRNVYRKVSGVFMLIGGVADNNPGSIVLDEDKSDQRMLQMWNSTDRATIEYPTGVTGAFDVYNSYNPTTGWSNSFVDFKHEGKPGNIFDARPILDFVDLAGKDIPSPDYYWIQSFFAREYLDNQPLFRECFIDLFRLRRSAKINVRGLDWYVGQGVTLKWLPNDTTPANNYVVKKVTLNLIEETAEIEAFSI